MAATPSDISLGPAVSAGSYPTRTWLADRDAGRLTGLTDGLEAMAQAVDIALHVRRFHWQIYTPNVGHELEILGADYGWARVGLQAQVREALSADDRIIGVEDFQFSREEDRMTAAFTVRTIFGTLKGAVRI